MHADIAVGQYDDVMRDPLAHVDEVCNLRIGAHHARIDHELDRRAGIRGTQPLDHSDRGIVGVFHSEHDLNRPGIILFADRHEIFEQPASSPCSGLRIVTAGAEASNGGSDRVGASTSAAARIMYRQPNAPAAHSATSRMSWIMARSLARQARSF